MRKIVFLFLLTMLCTSVFSQIIKGTIYDKQTNEVVCFANIYINGTFVGSLSDENGNFELNVSQYPAMPLTVSFIGYYNLVLTDYENEKPLLIYLEPKTVELNDVVVSSKSLVRKRRANLNLFKSVFIGTSVNASQCEILNEADITFNYNTDRDTLKAFVSKPIQIENKALGYKITYYLDKFEYCRNNRSFVFVGNIVFTEDQAVEELTQKYEKSRKEAYQGSRMQFFRTLWTGNLSTTGFIVSNSKDETLYCQDIVVQERSRSVSTPNETYKYLKYTGPLNIYNTGASKLNFLKTKVYFNESGYADEAAIIWEGEMAEKRVADMLPYEYRAD